MLTYQSAAVDWHDFVVGERYSEQLSGEFVFGRLVIDRQQYGVVQYQEVCVGRRQLFAVFVKDGVGQGQTYEVLGGAVGGCKRRELFFHFHERLKVYI